VPNTEASLENLSSFLFFIPGRHPKGKLGLGWSLAKVAVRAGAGHIHLVNRSLLITNTSFILTFPNFFEQFTISYNLS
jgi:hypothetical protein